MQIQNTKVHKRETREKKAFTPTSIMMIASLPSLKALSGWRQCHDEHKSLEDENPNVVSSDYGIIRQ
jgi:hypothetical protein